MGDLRNKARKQAEDAQIEDRRDRHAHGWTVFHFDLKPSLTRSNMRVGEAVRHLMRVTGTKFNTWRCPVRGLALEYWELPRTRMVHDNGVRYRWLHFSTLADERAARQELAVDMLLCGVGLYRAFPNAYFIQQTGLVRELLLAPPSISAEDWNKAKAGLHTCLQTVLETHQPELRFNLLGQRAKGRQTGTVAIGVEVRADSTPPPPGASIVRR